MKHTKDGMLEKANLSMLSFDLSLDLSIVIAEESDSKSKLF